jgi:hypothetical protein
LASASAEKEATAMHTAVISKKPRWRAPGDAHGAVPTGLLRLAAPLMRRYMQAQQERNVATIKALLEGRGA